MIKDGVVTCTCGSAGLMLVDGGSRYRMIKNWDFVLNFIHDGRWGFSPAPDSRLYCTACGAEVPQHPMVEIYVKATGTDWTPSWERDAPDPNAIFQP